MALFPEKKRSDREKAKGWNGTSRLNYYDEKCSQQYISSFGHKYCEVAVAGNDIPILRFRSRDFAIMKISKMSVFYCFLLFIFLYCCARWKKGVIEDSCTKALNSFLHPEGDCMFSSEMCAKSAIGKKLLFGQCRDDSSENWVQSHWTKFI